MVERWRGKKPAADSKGDSMPCVVILMGLQASGKTTFSRTCFSSYTSVSLDVEKTRTREMTLFLSALERNEDVVIDNTNTTCKQRARYIDIAKKHGATIKGYFFESKVSDCIARNELRTGKEKVPRLAIAGTSNKMQLPCFNEGFNELYFVTMTRETAGFTISEWRDK